MEVQVIPPAPAVDFHYDSASTSPYATAPSSPQSTIPFTWEEKPGIPKQNDNFKQQEEDLSLHVVVTDTDFAFGYLERHSISAADELFDCGKIKPLKPPPRLHSCNDSPKSPKSVKLGFIEALSPRSRKKQFEQFDQFDPFSEALKQTRSLQSQFDEQLDGNQPERGRERTSKSNQSNQSNRSDRSHKVSRSLSPFRVSNIVNDRKSSQSSPTWYNKWNLKNLLLFRSTSEGSATTRKKNQSFSFRSADGGESSGKSAAEDEGFTAAEENSEVRRKNSSVSKSGLMRCLRFNQGGSVHEISKGMINSVMKQ